MQLFVTGKTIVRYISLTLIGMMLIFFADYLGFFEGINNYIYDLSFRVRGSIHHDEHIIIAAIDEKTLKEFGRWPLRRLYYADLLDSVSQAKVVGFDIIMAEPSEDDKAFADAISRYGKVVMPVYIDSRLHITAPSPVFTPYKTGHIHVEQGVDGIVRRVFHTIYQNNNTLPSFSSVLYETVSGKYLKREKLPDTDRSKSSENTLMQMEPMNINYYGPSETFQYISLADILHGMYPASFFKDKIILVGLTTAGLEDKMLTPFTQRRDRMSGVEVHANILNNLLDSSNITYVSLWASWVLVIMLSIICFLLFLKLNEKRATLFWFGCLAMITGSVFLLFSVMHIWLTPASFYFSVSFIFLITYIFRLEKIGRLLFFAKEEWENTFNDINDAIVVHDNDFNVVRANKAAEDILNQPFFEKIKSNWFGQPHEDIEATEGNQPLKTMEYSEISVQEIFEPDSRRHLEIKSIPRFDKKESFAGAIHIVRDITKKKQADEKIKTQVEHLNALRNIDMAITASLDLQITLDIFLEEVIAQLHIHAADVLLLNQHTQSLEYAQGRGFLKALVQRKSFKIGEGFAGQAAKDNKNIIVPDIDKTSLDNMDGSFFRQEKIKSYFGFPLTAKGRVHGVLELYHRTLFEPDAEWLDFLENLTSQAAIAIDNARMFDEVQRSRDEIMTAYDATIEGWSRALDFRDRETEWHSRRVADMTIKVAKKLQLSDDELLHLRRGALLHDIGKLGVPDNILRKPDKLNPEEWVIMKRHSEIAYEILSPIAFLRPALDIPYCHHEKWDGSGYPRGLREKQIPLSARIFAIVDVWDALRSDRPNRTAWPEEKVIEHIRSLSGSHFDPDIADVFLKMDW